MKLSCLDALMSGSRRAAACALVFAALGANAANLTTTNNQASGQNWNGTIWKTSPTATGVAPSAGNTYETIYNGIAIGGNLKNTLVRNPATSGVQTFPGDSFTLDANTELRAKQSGAILNFPGVNGNPGLILNGGLMDAGDDATFSVTGRILVAAQSYISQGASGDGSISVNRGFNFSGWLTGTGNLVILNAGTTVAQQFSGTTNTFSGQWFVRCGWLLGSGTNSLGTNSITVDPNYSGELTTMPNFVVANGTAQVEVNYDLNSAGVLTLVNGGKMVLHQNCAFSAVMIEGTSLARGTHSYAELKSLFPANFSATGSGSITVQPYGPLVLLPILGSQPAAEKVFAGANAQFSVTAANPVAGVLGYSWQKNGAPLSDGGNISGSSTATLTVSSVSVADLASYTVIITNSVGSVTSSAAALTLVSPTGEAYEAAVIAAHPFAFYELNETDDPTNAVAVAYDFVGGSAARYGIAVQNGNAKYGIAGPSASASFPGFAGNNTAAQFVNGKGGSQITTPTWNLNTNTVTLTAWLNPNGSQASAEGIVFCRAGNTVAGLDYTTFTDGSGNHTLGYTWNNEYDTYNWDSQIAAPPGQWSFVALVITPTNATIHVMNANGLAASTHAYVHTAQAFAGPTLIGDDALDGGNGSRGFNGIIDDVAVFNRALTKAELTTLFYTASGVSHYAPVISVEPVAPITIYEQQTVKLSAAASGSDPLSYQWSAAVPGTGTFSPLSDNGRISGSQTATLTLANVTAADSLDYQVVVTNPYGTTNSTVATLYIQPVSGPAQNITMTTQEATGADWDTVGAWSDGNAASVSAVAYPGSTYEVLPGARLRSPVNPTTATFPGQVITVDGDGVWNVNPGAGATIGEIRFKEPTYGAVDGTVIFPKLVMNGGQLDAGADSGGGTNIVHLGGEIDVLTNAPLNNDNGADRGYYINAKITGRGTIEYHGYNQTVFQTNYTRPLNIAGTANTFSGKWNVVMGTLLGSALNCLGTNDIIVGTNGAVETTYDINNPTGNLLISGAGRVFLHQNDSFASVIVNGQAANPGTYTAAQLNALYPLNFPTNWQAQVGSGISTASGSITILAQASPKVVTQPVSETLYAGQNAQFTVFAIGNATLSYQWRAGAPGSGVYTNLSNGGQFSGVTSTTLTITGVTAGNAADYVVVVNNSVGSATSLPANLTVLATSPAENITLQSQQASGLDWDSTISCTNWSDCLAASVSAVSKPGSTYEILPGARLRTPAAPTLATFPGDILTVDGNGVLTNSFGAGSTTMGELRFKHSAATGAPGTVYFKRLVMNGGQMDSGDNGLIILAGEVDIETNTPIYADSGAGQERPYEIDALLTGTGTIEYHDFDSAFGTNGGLNIAGNNNTFSGAWNVVTGTLLGTGTNALGTNTITVGTGGALETTYDINNPNGTLNLNGRMFLHQNDTFAQVNIAGVALLPGTYTFTQLTNLYATNFPATWAAQLGAANFSSGSGSITVLRTVAPVITVQPAQPLYVGETAQLTIPALGGQPTYQWQVGANGAYTTINDGAQFTGSTTPNLTVKNLTLANAGDYIVRVTGASATVTSLVATLNVQVVGAPTTITMSQQEPQNMDWESATYWSDGLAASRSVVGNPGSTYEILPGARLRTPGAAANTNFPGSILVADGDGVFVSDGSPTISEVRFKHANPGTVYFNKLVMNGGQIGNGDNGLIVIAGEMDINSNTPIYVTTGSTAERPFQIDAWLTGKGAIEYHAYDSFTGNLNVTGSTNTFSGAWNIVQGVLLGSGPNSLGYGDLNIGDTNGSPASLETLYNINNPRGNLNLGTGGQFFLHQDDKFAGVTIGGVVLPVGTYSFDYLANNYPANFPTGWTQQAGSSFSTGSGSITVLGAAPPDVTLQTQVVGSTLKLTWSQGTLMRATDVRGPWTAVSGATSPYVINPTGPRAFYRILVQ